MSWRSIVLAALVLVTACGDPSTERSVESRAQEATTAEAWLATTTDSVLLVRWTEDESGQVSGVLQLAHLVDFAVEGESLSIDGMVTNGTVTLSVDGLFGTSTTLTGELSRGELTLFWPDETGTLHAVPFHRASISDYNNAVAALEDVGAQQAQAAYEAEAGGQALAQADNRLASARRQLENAIQGVGDAQSWAGYSLEGVRSTLDILQEDVSQLEQTVEDDPEYAGFDLEAAESTYAYLQEEADYALGADSLGVIRDALADVEAAISNLEVAIEVVRWAEDMYLGTEFAPYDATAEVALIKRAQTILDETGPTVI
ncbi:MAG: hypothetical protein ACREA0_32410, partial [bacterium]